MESASVGVDNGRAPIGSMDKLFAPVSGQAPASANGTVAPQAAETAAPASGAAALTKIIINDPEQMVEFMGREVKVKDLEGEMMLRKEFNKKETELQKEKQKTEAEVAKAKEANDWLTLIADDPVLASAAQMKKNGVPAEQIYRTMAQQIAGVVPGVAPQQYQQPASDQPPLNPDGTRSEPGDIVYDRWERQRELEARDKEIAALKEGIGKLSGILQQQQQETEAERNAREQRDRIHRHNVDLIKERYPALLKEKFGESFEVAKLSEAHQQLLAQKLNEAGKRGNMNIFSDEWLSGELLKERDVQYLVDNIPKDIFTQQTVSAAAPIIGAAQQNGQRPLGSGGPSAGGVGVNDSPLSPDRAPSATAQLDNWISAVQSPAK